jgi:repressor LexA
MVSVPLFERIAVGPPVIANPDSEDIMRLPGEMVGSGVLFAVRVVGDSMVNAGIERAIVKARRKAHGLPAGFPSLRQQS